jgi:hypothetical protein
VRKGHFYKGAEYFFSAAEYFGLIILEGVGNTVCLAVGEKGGRGGFCSVDKVQKTFT